MSAWSNFSHAVVAKNEAGLLSFSSAFSRPSRTLRRFRWRPRSSFVGRPRVKEVDSNPLFRSVHCHARSPFFFLVPRCLPAAPVRQCARLFQCRFCGPAIRSLPPPFIRKIPSSSGDPPLIGPPSIQRIGLLDSLDYAMQRALFSGDTSETFFSSRRVAPPF